MISTAALLPLPAPPAASQRRRPARALPVTAAASSSGSSRSRSPSGPRQAAQSATHLAGGISAARPLQQDCTDPGSGGSPGQEQQQQRQQQDQQRNKEAHKQLNSRICSAGSAGALLELVGAELPGFNLVNAATAFHRLAKVGGGVFCCL